MLVVSGFARACSSSLSAEQGPVRSRAIRRRGRPKGDITPGPPEGGALHGICALCASPGTGTLTVTRAVPSIRGLRGGQHRRRMTVAVPSAYYRYQIIAVCPSPITGPTRRPRSGAPSSPSATRAPKRPTPAAAPLPTCSANAVTRSCIGQLSATRATTFGAVLDEALGRDDVDVVLTTGGTGISSRDGTFEIVSGLLEKPLDGFGELFRMLSYTDIGPAAMLTRACAGLARRKILVSMPGSEAAVRLAMHKLLLPELGHHRARGAALNAPPCRTAQSSPLRTRAPSSRRAVSQSRAPNGSHCRTFPDACSPRISVAAFDVPPFARAAMDGYAVVAADTTGARRDSPVALTLGGSVYTGDVPGHRVTPVTASQSRPARHCPRARTPLS